MKSENCSQTCLSREEVRNLFLLYNISILLALIEYCRKKLLMDKEEVVPRTRMSLSEIMTILIMYHLSGYKTFKWYYTKHIMVHQRKDFSDLVSYNRFVEIMKFALVPLILYTIKREFDRKNQSSRPKKSFCILEAEQTEGFLGRKE